MTEKTTRPGYATDFVKGDFDRSVYLGNPHVDNLMAVVTALGAENWTMRRRLMVLERFLAEKKVLDLAAYEAYEPDAAEKAAWDEEREDFMERVFAVLMRSTGPVQGEMPSDNLQPPVA
jgi:hypothetical protein